MHSRVRWGNLARVAGALLVAALIVAWPRLAPREPSLPRGEVVPVEGVEPDEVARRSAGMSGEGRPRTERGGRRRPADGDGWEGTERRRQRRERRPREASRRAPRDRAERGDRPRDGTERGAAPPGGTERGAAPPGGTERGAAPLGGTGRREPSGAAPGGGTGRREPAPPAVREPTDASQVDEAPGADPAQTEFGFEGGQ
jgi:hypothetical protein